MAYADTDQLFEVLSLARSPSAKQIAAADRILEMAAGEIDAEINLGADQSLEAWHYELLATVNIARAAEIWLLEKTPYGFTGIGSEVGTPYMSRKSWEKYAEMLAPVKGQWGLA
jgi:hypothetical protein